MIRDFLMIPKKDLVVIFPDILSQICVPLNDVLFEK